MRIHLVFVESFNRNCTLNVSYLLAENKANELFAVIKQKKRSQDECAPLADCFIFRATHTHTHTVCSIVACEQCHNWRKRKWFRSNEQRKYSIDSKWASSTVIFKTFQWWMNLWKFPCVDLICKCETMDFVIAFYRWIRQNAVVCSNR